METITRPGTPLRHRMRACSRSPSTRRTATSAPFASWLAAAPNLKHQAAMSVACGAGLRVSEVVSLKVSDIDGQRMTLRVEQGKGRRDRYAMLSPVLLERLRAWWRLGRAQGEILPEGWLFPGMDPTDHVTARQLNRAVHLASATAGRTSG